MSRLSIISVLRTTPGLDEFPIYRALLARDPDLMNFDDRAYGFHATPNRLAWIARRLNRAAYARALNTELQRHLAACRPQLLVLFKAPHLQAQTVRHARALGARVVVIYPDLDPRVHGDDYLQALRAADRFYFTKPNLVGHFKQVVRADAQLISPLYSRHDLADPQPADPKLGVAFVGHHSPGKAASLASFAAGYDGPITVIGEGWLQQSQAVAGAFPHMQLQPPLYGAAVRSVFRQAVCNLGLLMEPLQHGGQGDEITSRSVLVPACGGLLLHQRTPAAQVLYGADSPWLFDSLTEATSMAQYLRVDESLRREWTLRQKRAVQANARCAEDLVESWLDVP